MKALSIKQPWAWAILHAGKDVENRDWKGGYRGVVAIHASKTLLARDVEDFEAFTGRNRILKTAVKRAGWPDVTPATGAIVGLAQITDCKDWSPSPWAVGAYCFDLADVFALPEPIPMLGALGFWELDNPHLRVTGKTPPDVEAAIRTQVWANAPAALAERLLGANQC